MAHGVKRRAFAREQVATYWGMNKPYFCMRCAATQWSLEMAHVVDLGGGGADALNNIGLLCPGCHAMQPMSGQGGVSDEEAYHYFGLDPHQQCLTEPKTLWHRRVEYLRDEIGELQAHLRAAIFLRDYEESIKGE